MATSPIVAVSSASTPPTVEQANSSAPPATESTPQTRRSVDYVFPDPKTGVYGASKVFDDDWIKTTFIISDKDLDSSNPYADWIKKQRYRTSADDKFTCTSPGMSLAVNPKPQFTRYADIRSKGRIPSRPDISVRPQSHPSGLGMGHYYSMAIDDNEQRVFMRFGVPQYIPLPVWIYKAFDINRTVLHGRGVLTTAFLGAVSMVTSFFAIVGSISLALIMGTLDVLASNSRFYSVKPTMYSYWATVDNILNALVARRTMLPHMIRDYTYKRDTTIGQPPAISESFIRDLSSYIPDIIDSRTGRISVYAIALRAQATYNKIKQEQLARERNPSSISQAVFGPTDDEGASVTTQATEGSASTRRSGMTISEWLFKKAGDWLMPSESVDGLDQNKQEPTSVIGYNDIFRDASGNPMSMSLDPNDPNDSVDKRIEANVADTANHDKWSKIKNYAMAELTEGAAFAVFNVEHTGSVGESFSSSFTSNPIEATFNSLSSKTGAITTAIGQVGDSLPFLGDTLKLLADTGATVLSAASFKLANPLLALAYGVNITMPKVWEQSSANLPNSTYKMKLISPYGNAYSQLFSIYLPYAMIAAGSLPRSTGASSYMSPFFCQSFDRGRNNISLGMIRDLNAVRGTSNLPFTRAGHPNAIDIEFSIANLDEIVAVDVSSNGALMNGIAQLSLDFSDTPFVSYLNTVAAVDVYTMTNRIPMMRLKMAERLMNLNAYTDPDPAMFGAATVNNFPGGKWVRDILGENSQTLAQLQGF